MSTRWMAAIFVWLGVAAIASSADPVIRSTPPARTPQAVKSPYKSPAPAENRIILAEAVDEPEPSKSGESYNRDSADAEQDVPIPDYPPEPVWPTWTAANDPSKQPIFAPAGIYDLVRPAHGFLQTLEDQDYERVVASEADLIYDQATCPPPIDLYRPDGMAPAGVFGDHTLNTGGRVLLSYRFNNTSYDGLLNGTQSVSTASTLAKFPMAPVHETAQTYYLLFEYGPTDNFTFQYIMPIVLRRIQFVGTGSPLVTDVTDIYDLQFNTMWVVKRWDRQQVHLNMGLRTPNGIFDQQGQVPTPTSPVLTYPMRTSDGTFDMLPGVTYRGQSDHWTWGAQALGTVRFGINSHGYRLGNELDLNGWASRRLTESLSASIRLNGTLLDNIFGADQRLNANLTPTNRPNLQGGQVLNLFFGLNYRIPTGILQGQFLGFEGGFPAYQSLSGPQLQQRYQIWSSFNFLF